MSADDDRPFDLNELRVRTHRLAIDLPEIYTDYFSHVLQAIQRLEAEIQTRADLCAGMRTGMEQLSNARAEAEQARRAARQGEANYEEARGLYLEAKAERDGWENERNEWKQEADAARAEVAETRDRMAAVEARMHQRRAERDSLSTENAGLREQVERVTQERDEALADGVLSQRMCDALNERDQARSELAVLKERRFPILNGPSVPWSLVAPYERQARENHSQTLEELAARGGLDAGELWCVVHGKRLRDVPLAEGTQAWLRGWLVEHEGAQAQLASLSTSNAGLRAQVEGLERERDEARAALRLACQHIEAGTDPDEEHPIARQCRIEGGL